jgi:phage terminase large subunit-like protein
MTLLDLCRDPNLIFGIFSYNNKTATQFVDQIKRECESNLILPWAFPEVFYENPKKDSPTWSLEKGLIFKRSSNPKETTISGWGLVDNMPTGWHFTHMIYDDVVTKDSVTTSDMIQKTTQAMELSFNLESTRDGIQAIKRMIGTRYAYGDTWQHVIDRQIAKPRLYPCMDERGKPVFLPEALIKKKQREMGNTFYSQMMLDPRADSPKGFKRDNIKFYDRDNLNYKQMNLYMLCDPANSKKKHSDWTVMLVIGLVQPDNYYLIDAIRDRLSLPERIKAWINLHRKWHPKSKILKAGYEGYGKDADIEAIEMEMDRQAYKFTIQKLKGNISKEDRIDWLLPITEDHRLYLPRQLNKTIYDGSNIDLIEYLIEMEFLQYPVSEYDDFMDCLSRIVDPEFKVKWPIDNKASFKINYPKLGSIA